MRCVSTAALRLHIQYKGCCRPGGSAGIRVGGCSMTVSPFGADGRSDQARLGRRVGCRRRVSHLPAVMLALLLVRPRVVPVSNAFLCKKGTGHLPVYRRLTNLGAVVDRVGSSPLSARALATQSLLSSVQTVKGVGSQTGGSLGKLGINSVLDLVLHMPTGVEDWRQVTSVKDIVAGETATVAVRINEHVLGFGKKPYVIHCEDEEGTPIDLTFFHGGGSWLQTVYPINEQRVVRGKAVWSDYNKRYAINMPKTPNAKMGLTVEPIYKLTEGVTSSKLQGVIRDALDSLPDFPDWLPERLRASKGWPSFHQALYEVHNPKSSEDCLGSSKARERLAFDELTATMLPIQLRRARQSCGLDPLLPVDPLPAIGSLTDACIANLPFRLTPSQEQCMQEIWSDMATSSQRRMVRLLQGDVGSGKTVCAVLAMLRAVEGGGQAALLVPTEILVNQHNNTIVNMCKGLTVTTPEGIVRPLRIEVLSTSLKKGKAKKALLDDVKAGEVDILIGTHALLSGDVKFPALGLVVVDEEHRFGVTQREALAGDGENVLYMTATPIPRTMFLACYSQMEVSSLERPMGSGSPVQVSIMKMNNLQTVLDGIKRVVNNQKKDKIFWVLPRIEDRKVAVTEEEGQEQADPLSGVMRRYETLVELLGEDQVRMVHGKLDAETKFKALQDFTDGDASVLVSTSVIEVGVDVPDATVCVVENADMFGLSQLHQLRGRVGRSAIHSATRKREHGEEGQTADGEESRQCHCVLIFDDQSPSQQKTLERLSVLKKTTDGLEVAEYDLRRRGPGDLLGAKQSGYKAFRLANLQVHGELIVEANEWAEAQAKRMAEREAALVQQGRGEEEEDEPFHALLELFGNLQEEVRPPAATRKKRVVKPKEPSVKTIPGLTVGTHTTVTKTSTSTTTVTRSPRGSAGQKKTVTTTYSSDEIWARLDIHTPEEAGRPRPPTFTVPKMKLLKCPPSALRDAVYIVFDTETTTLQWQTGCIIQLAGRLYQPGEDTVEWRDEKAYDEFTNPGVVVPPEAFSVHGISTQHLIDHARPFPEVYGEFLDWIKEVGNGRPVFFVVHNADFDRAMLLSELYKHNMDDRSLREEANVKGIICSLKLIRNLDYVWAAPGQPGVPRPVNNKLVTLYTDLCGDMRGEHHKANFDVRFLSEILYHPQLAEAWLAEAHKYVYSLGGDEDSVVV